MPHHIHSKESPKHSEKAIRDIGRAMEKDDGTPQGKGVDLYHLTTPPDFSLVFGTICVLPT
ncbi:hypothetical protein EK904_001909 [Melospiza melodia maxima]|nr:hypothetical protein EK904_001909 [Melospiza melodia maxima]